MLLYTAEHGTQYKHISNALCEFFHGARFVTEQNRTSGVKREAERLG